MRYDELLATGDALIETPHLARLIYEGVTFKSSVVIITRPGEITTERAEETDQRHKSIRG
jgi:hypothetical protein